MGGYSETQILRDRIRCLQAEVDKLKAQRETAIDVEYYDRRHQADVKEIERLNQVIDGLLKQLWDNV